MWTLWQDLRYSARLLLKHPGFTLTAIGVLTLGIGVNAGIFGIINGLMIRPLAGADAPGEVVGVYSQDRTTERGYRAVLVSRIRRRARRRRAVRSTSPRTTSRSPASPRTAPRARRMVDIVSHRLFRGARRRAGLRPRLHASTRNVPAPTARPVIISYALWERVGFDRDILKTDRPHQRPGLSASSASRRAGFSGTTAIIGTEYFLPLGVHDAIESDFDSRRTTSDFADRRNRSLIVVGRLKPAVTREQANEQLKVIAAAHEQAYPDREQEPGSRRAAARPA